MIGKAIRRAREIYSYRRLSQRSNARRDAVPAGVFGLVAETQIGTMVTPIDDMFVSEQLLTDGVWQEEELARLLPLIRPDDAVLIVGAHIGSLALPLSKHCRKLVAIEANPDTFRVLRMNVLINQRDNIEPIHIAVDEKEGELSFVKSRANSGGAKRMPKLQRADYFFDKPEVVTVKTARLDDLLAGQEFGFVLMDIEGSEYFALKGGQRILAGARALAIEYLPHHLEFVAGVTPEQFTEVIAPHFDQLYVPVLNETVQRPQFDEILRRMFDKQLGDDGIIFTKTGA
jgi:FkbM family methyltransferase